MSLQSEEIQAKREGKLLSRRTFIKATSAALAVTAAAALGIKTKEAEASDSAQPPGNEFLQQVLPTSVEFHHIDDDRFIENLPGPAGSNQEILYFQAQDDQTSHVIVMGTTFDQNRQCLDNFVIEGLPPIRYNHPYVKLLSLPDGSHLAFINGNVTPEIGIYKIDPQTRTATFLRAHTLGNFIEGQIDAFEDIYDSGKIKYILKDPNSLNLCLWEYVPETGDFNLIADNIRGAPSVLSARRLSDHWLLIASETDPGAVPTSNIILSTVDMYSPQTSNQTPIESVPYSGAEVVWHPRSGAMFCYVNKDGHPCVESFDPRTRERTPLFIDSHYAEINRPGNNYPKGVTMCLFYHEETNLWLFRCLDTSGNIWETRIDGGGVIVQNPTLISTATIMETGGWGQIPHYIKSDEITASCATSVNAGVWEKNNFKIFFQPSAEPTPTPEPTVTATATGTAVPTETASPTPPSSQTPGQPTATVPATAIATETASPTATARPEATATPHPTTVPQHLIFLPQALKNKGQ